MTTIERVCRALGVIDGIDPDAIGGQFVPKRRWYIPRAIIVIKAMREPSEAMTRAGTDKALSVTISGDYRWPDYVGDLFSTMIDAALAEGPSSL